MLLLQILILVANVCLLIKCQLFVMAFLFICIVFMNIYLQFPKIQFVDVVQVETMITPPEWLQLGFYLDTEKSLRHKDGRKYSIIGIYKPMDNAISILNSLPEDEKYFVLFHELCHWVNLTFLYPIFTTKTNILIEKYLSFDNWEKFKKLFKIHS